MPRIICVLFCIFSLINSCSVAASLSSNITYQMTTEELIIEDKSKKYPHFNVDFGSFIVVNAPLQPGVVETEELLNAYHKLTIKEKRYMLRNLDIIKFVVNTPEFEEALYNRTYRASRKGSGPNGIVAFGDHYDKGRLLKLIRNRKYALSIHKDRITKNAQAVGVLGEFLYVLDDNDPRSSNPYWIAMPNDEIWDRGFYIEEDIVAPIVFHEMMHNTGFSHGMSTDDTVYGLQYALAAVLKDKSFKIKYFAELERFRPFYENKYKGWVKNDTISYNKYSSYIPQKNYTANNMYYDGVYCVINNDNTHTMYTNLVR